MAQLCDRVSGFGHKFVKSLLERSCSTDEQVERQDLFELEEITLKNLLRPNLNLGDFNLGNKRVEWTPKLRHRKW
jgi:hypothetical protein